jgi:hypothetical protein
VKARTLICLISFFTISLNLALPGEKQPVAKQLQAYYEKGTAPPWADALKELAGEAQAKRGAAAKYLVSLLDQAQTDELSGKAPWRATPYWGSSGENPARNLRKQVADELAKAPSSPATLTVVRWYLDHEKVSRFQESAIVAIDKVKEKDAGEFCLKLLQPPHENSVVVLAALDQLAKRKTDIPDAVLKSLCDHYRPSLREAARKLNKERGGADPGPFDGAKAMQRPAIAALMTSIGALVDQPAPPDAEFVKVTTKWTAGDRTETTSTLGWLIKDNKDSWTVLTPFGHRETFQKGKTIKNSRGGDSTSTSTREKFPIADEVKRVAALRKKGDPEFELSERGGLTGQFQGRTAGVYEVTLAHWLYTAKQFDLSAQLLLPALDSLYMDSHLVDMMRHRVGEAAGYRMLVAFAGDRDFAETRRLADAIVKRYPGTRFHEYAVKFAREMPKRQDDFKKLKLPTPDEWAALKKKLSRAEQITYLAERIRLLNCFQWGQPGGYSIADVQYAEPGGMSRDASFGGGEGTTRVINPYVELVGGEEGIFRGREENTKIKGMELKVADIALLAPHLRDDWHILCVSFWRNFHPDRNLGTTRPLIAEIINDLSKRDLSRVRDMSSMSEADIDKHIKKMILWSQENAKKTEDELAWEGLEDEVKAGQRFYWLRNYSVFLQRKDKRLVPILLKYVDELDPKGHKEEPRTGAWDEQATASILADCLALDPPAFKVAVKRLADHHLTPVRLLVGRILHAGGEKEEARKVFAPILEKGDPFHMQRQDLPAVFEALLSDRSEPSTAVARLLFKNKRYVEIEDGAVRVSLVQQCGDAGIGDGYLAYLPLLEVPEKGKEIAKELTNKLAPKDPEIVRITKMFPKASDQIAPLKEWLKAKAKFVEKPQSK